jgi:pimeloyl-ACP methyl ester carboxylesterase
MWVWVQPAVAATTRVCAYDRAGWGWSDDGPAPRDAAQHARELRTLLERAGVPGPYVLVGHSLGGLYARSYADHYPEGVAGMVLVDASHPDQARRFSPEQRAEDESLDWLLPMLSMSARLGMMRLYFDLGGTMDFEDLPARQRDEAKMFWSLPRQWDNQAADQAVRPDTDAQLRAAAGLGDRPLLVVTAARGASPEWLALQAEMVGLSTNSAQRLVPDGTHVSLAFHPDHARLTARAILDVVAAAVTGARVRP